MKKTKPVNAAILLQRLSERVANTPPVRRPRARPKGALIEQLREPLQALQVEHQCSLLTLAALLAECGFQIHVSTLRRYLGPTHTVRPDSSTSLASSTSSTHTPAVILPRAPKPDLSKVVVPDVPPAPASAPATEVVPPQQETSRLQLTSRFTPKPEVPYSELVRQSAARKPPADTTPVSDDPPESPNPPTSAA